MKTPWRSSISLLLPDISAFLECGAIFRELEGRLWLGFGPTFSSEKAPCLEASQPMARRSGEFLSSNPSEAPKSEIGELSPSHQNFSQVRCDGFFRQVQGTHQDLNWEVPWSCELKNWKSYEGSEIEVLKAALANYVEVNSGGGQRAALPFTPPLFEDFESEMIRVKNLISSGRVKKLVPCVFAKREKAPGSVEKAYWILRALNQPNSLRAYGLWEKSQGVLGLTPESLYKKRGDFIEVMALAGTRSLGANSLFESSKDLHEHQLVVEGLKLKLGELVEEVQVGSTEEIEYGQIVHLKTQLSGRIDPAKAKDVLRCDGLDSGFISRDFQDQNLVSHFHPTAALGGFPLKVAYDLLSEFESSKERGRFGAPFLFTAPKGDQEALVAIRSIEWTGDQCRIGSGCGVVDQSESEKEWKELSLKRRVVRELFGVEEASKLGG